MNKLFLQKKLYIPRMSDGNMITKKLNAFNTIINQEFSVDIKLIIEEEKCISLLFSLLDSWESLVVAIGRNNTTLKLNDVVVALLLEEMR